mgnify:CR=1 FL=1
MEKQRVEWWKRRSIGLLGLGLGIATFTFAQMIVYSLHMLFGWNIPFDVMRICNMWMKNHGLFSVSHGLEVLVLCTFVLFIGYALDQIYRSYRVLKRCYDVENRALSEQFDQRYRPNGGRIFLIVRYAKPIAFTIGMTHRRVVLSDGLLQLLDKEELEAVVHHELFHYDNRDPLKTFLLTQAAFALWFLPVLRSIVSHYKISREILADQAAIQQLGTPAGIGSALLKLVNRMQLPSRIVCSSFAETSINYRIHRIIEPDSGCSPRLGWWSIMISLPILVLLSVLLLWSLV